jgi:hypothetical protein
MESRHFIISSQSDIYALNNRLNTAFGYPTLDGQTLTYGIPKAHNSNSQFALEIEERCLPFLTQGEIDSLVDINELEQEGGWFKGPGE